MLFRSEFFFLLKSQILVSLKKPSNLDFSFLILRFVMGPLLALQVSYLVVITMEAARNVCNVHVGCPAAAGS